MDKKTHKPMIPTPIRWGLTIIAGALSVGFAVAMAKSDGDGFGYMVMCVCSVVMTEIIFNSKDELKYD